MMVLKTDGRDRPYAITFEANDTLSEIAAVMKCDVYDLMQLIGELWMDDWNGQATDLSEVE